MFTGIVSAVGAVVSAEPNRLGIEHAPTTRQMTLGASVAVNGCCLTVVKRSKGTFFADLVPETLRRTSLGALKLGSRVNVELPLAASGRLDGHFVQGHVDAKAKVKRVTPVRLGREVEIELPTSIRRFVAEKGSIAVDGASLTVSAVGKSSFTVALIPHTLAVTVARDYKSGTVVNLEADVLARYVAGTKRG